MSLEEYRAKRKPSTPEPFSSVVDRLGPLYFVIQLHRATRKHFDFRLEINGVLVSWAVPRGISDNPEDKRLATRTEDHPFDYGAFEGAIPAGRYGAGEVLLWDFGTWFCDENAPLPSSESDWFDPEFRKAHQDAALKALEDGKLSVFLRGHRAKGSYFLVKTKEDYLMIKHRDAWANVHGAMEDILTSSLTGRNWEEIARGTPPKNKWFFQKAPIGTMGTPNEMIPFGPQEKLPKKLLPMKTEQLNEPFSHQDWLFEPKLDGIRVLVTCVHGKVSMMSRNGNDVTSQFPEVARELALQPGVMVLDAEIVAFEDGKAGFTPMMKRFHLKDSKSLEAADLQWPCVLFVFDLLHFEGMNLRSQPLLERKRWLAQALMPTKRIQLVESFNEDGVLFYQAATAAGFEGVVAKKIDSKYDASGKKSPLWVKIKHTNTGDFVVGGLVKGEGNRSSTFGSFVIGAYDENGDLRCVGRVGSGFKDSDLETLKEEFEPLATKENPFVGEVPLDAPTWWVKPEKVIEVTYSEMMPGGHLRAPVFNRMRPDLDPNEVFLPGKGKPLVIAGARKEKPLDSEALGVVQGIREDSLVTEVIEQLSAKAKDITLQIGDKKLSVTNLDKQLWPTATKRDLLIYLAKVSSAMLTHLRERPITLIRYPDGISGEKFFQKHIEHRPDWVQTIEFWGDTNKKNQQYLLVDDLATLLWMGQLGTIEFHAPAGRITANGDGEGLPLTFTDSDENLDRSVFNYPDFIRFDLDPYVYSGNEKPGEEPELNRDAFEKTKTAAFQLREMIEPLGMKCFIKTTGKTGLHMFVPIQRTIDTQAARQICMTFCLLLEKQHPRAVTTEWSVSKRTGKIFLDYNMNGTGRTLGAAYSPRATASKAVSLPVTWDELADCYPEDFTLETAPVILAERGDVWSGILDAKIDLTSLVEGMNS